MSKQPFVVFVAVLLLPIGFVLATSNYEYGPDEYVTIANGICPDGKFAITAHGSGYLGYDNFHLYLTDAANGKNIARLNEIVDTRDTGADAFSAMWSADSREVTIIYRVGRPLKAVTYRIRGERPHLVKGPFDVKTDSLGRFRQSHSSHSQPSPKVFGIPLEHDSNA